MLPCHTTTCLLNPFLFAQTLLFPQYKHALSGSAQFVEGHTLLEERVSLAKMVGDGTESTIYIAAVDAIVFSSLWHRSLLLILLLCCRVSFHDSTLDSKQGAWASITFYCSTSYAARSRLADHIWSLALFGDPFEPRNCESAFRISDLQGVIFLVDDLDVTHQWGYHLIILS